MAISTGPIIPQSINIGLNYSKLGDTGSKIQVSIAPKNADGSAYDATDATSITFSFDNGRDGVGWFGQDIVCTGADFAGAPGSILANLAKTVAKTLLTTLGATQGRLTASITDGANTVYMAYGTFNIQMRA
jgi:hypothetical protein